jgi:hypothetical protein
MTAATALRTTPSSARPPVFALRTTGTMVEIVHIVEDASGVRALVESADGSHLEVSLDELVSADAASVRQISDFALA